MRAIIIELQPDTDLVAELRQIRSWCKDHQCDATSFKYHLNSNALIVIAEFAENGGADLFKNHFGGLESEFTHSERDCLPDSIATACWWRLKAEEIRAEYDGFASPSARESMARVARCYDIMAAHLEYILTMGVASSASVDAYFSRLAFR